MKRAHPTLFVLSLVAMSSLPACIDPFVPPPTYVFRMVKLVSKGDEKVATLGPPDLASGHCAMRGDSAYVLKANGEGTFQGFTSTIRAGETWHQTASVLTEAGTTLFDLGQWNTSMDSANTWDPWRPRRFRFDSSLYNAMEALEFQGQCY